MTSQISTLPTGRNQNTVWLLFIFQPRQEVKKIKGPWCSGYAISSLLFNSKAGSVTINCLNFRSKASNTDVSSCRNTVYFSIPWYPLQRVIYVQNVWCALEPLIFSRSCCRTPCYGLRQNDLSFTAYSICPWRMDLTCFRSITGLELPVSASSSSISSNLFFKKDTCSSKESKATQSKAFVIWGRMSWMSKSSNWRLPFSLQRYWKQNCLKLA